MGRSVNYINNKSLYTSLVEYKTQVDSADRENKERPRIPRYIGEAIDLICKNLSRKSNFSGYSYKSEMVDDGIVDCIAGVNNFDPDKTQNPFAYFTQIAWNAFLRRIEKEKKETYVKHKNFQNLYLTGNIIHEEDNIHLKSNEYSDEVIKSFEEKLTKNKKAAKIEGIEKFVQEREEKDDC